MPKNTFTLHAFIPRILFVAALSCFFFAPFVFAPDYYDPITGSLVDDGQDDAGLTANPYAPLDRSYGPHYEPSEMGPVQNGMYPSPRAYPESYDFDGNPQAIMPYGQPQTRSSFGSPAPMHTPRIIPDAYSSQQYLPTEPVPIVPFSQTGIDPEHDALAYELARYQAHQTRFDDSGYGQQFQRRADEIAQLRQQAPLFSRPSYSRPPAVFMRHRDDYERDYREKQDRELRKARERVESYHRASVASRGSFSQDPYTASFSVPPLVTSDYEAPELQQEIDRLNQQQDALRNELAEEKARSAKKKAKIAGLKGDFETYASASEATLAEAKRRLTEQRSHNEERRRLSFTSTTYPMSPGNNPSRPQPSAASTQTTQSSISSEPQKGALNKLKKGVEHIVTAIKQKKINAFNDSLADPISQALANPNATEEDFRNLILPQEDSDQRTLEVSELHTYMQTVATLHARQQVIVDDLEKRSQRGEGVNKELEDAKEKLAHIQKLRRVLNERRHKEIETIKQKMNGHLSPESIKALEKEKARLDKAAQLTTAVRIRPKHIGKLFTGTANKSGNPPVRERLNQLKTDDRAKFNKLITAAERKAVGKISQAYMGDKSQPRTQTAKPATRSRSNSH